MAKSGSRTKEDSGRVADNPKAFPNDFIEETPEAGVQLAGTEVRSSREGGVNLTDS